MDDLNKDVTPDEEQGAAVGTDVEGGGESPAVDVSTTSKAEDQSTADTGDETDFESVLLAPDETGAEEEKKDGEAAPVTGLSDYLQSLKGLRESLDKLPENPDEGNGMKLMRKLNRELLSKHETEVAQFAEISQFGPVDRIKEALTLLDGLEGYDTTIGAPSASKAADLLATTKPEVAYNLALNVMRHSTPQGVAFAELFTRNVLKLDPQRLADFQAISRGEVPEGYEDMIASNDDLKAINPAYHEAFQRLSPKMRDIVKEGMEDYANVADKAEAERILKDSLKAINDVKAKDAEQAQKDADYTKNLTDKAVEIEGESTSSVGTKILTGLEKIVFSSDNAVDLTMKQALNTQIFNLVHESPFVRNQSEKYFKDMGLDMTKNRANIDYWFGRLSENIDIEAIARTKGQAQAAEAAHKVRLEAESRLAAIGLSLIVGVAKKTKAGLKAKGDPKLPENVLPPTDKETTSSQANNGGIDYRAAAAATREGKVLTARP